MEAFNYIFLLLAAVLIANLINRFIPLLSVPLIQIGLGVLIALFYYDYTGFEFYFEPQLFFVLFLAPLVFHSTRTSDLRIMRRMISPIVLAAVGLVLLSVFAIGSFANMLIPSIPLAAAFALAAALGPTDIVAVEAVAHRVKMPNRIQSILSGESIINDASGIVCFQFAVLAAATGAFNFLYGFGRFFILAIGGLVVGIIITIIKFALVRWLRNLNILVVSLHIAIGIVTPFVIYMIAEELGTSGILAVFSSGILHSLYKDKFNPEIISHNNATENVWSLLSFSLDGLVFVILGTQLPSLLRVEIGWASGFGGRQIVFYVLMIYLAIAVLRFFWWIITVRQKTYSDAQEPVGIIRAGLIFSMAGARGAVSMASILSIPLLLSNGAEFPERDLIILITCGIITISMLVTNFILPLLVKKNTDVKFADIEQEARTEILNTVINRLKESITPENISASKVIIHVYYQRLNKRRIDERSREGKRTRFGVRSGILLWEKDVVLHMIETGQISETQAEHYLDESERLYDEIGYKHGPIKSYIAILKHLLEYLTWKETTTTLERDMRKLKEIKAIMMEEKQQELHLAKDDPALAIIAAEHERVVSARMGLTEEANTSEHMVTEVLEVANNALYMERVLIQQMSDAGRLSPKTSKEMQANIILLEAQLHTEQKNGRSTGAVKPKVH
ncbi:MAG: sodium:proton antiporter [Lachnospiraceae bacterium]|nr:sodium:proton antiporter [Lachnospiraceae bacterium]